MHKPSGDVSWVRDAFRPVCYALNIFADNFETASLPTTSPEQRKRLLSFVICGGGPTGVETAAVRSDAS